MWTVDIYSQFMKELTLKEIAHGMNLLGVSARASGSLDQDCYFLLLREISPGLHRGIRVKFLDRVIEEVIREEAQQSEESGYIQIEGGFRYWSDHCTQTFEERLGFLGEAVYAMAEHNRGINSFYQA